MGGVELRAGAREKLQQLERAALRQRLEKRLGKPVRQLRQNETVRGTYAGVVEAHAGLSAMVFTDQHVYVMPVRRTPYVADRAEVTAQRVGGSVTVTPVLPAVTQTARQPGRTTGRGGGLEAGQ